MSRGSEDPRPIARSRDLIVKELDDELLIYDLQRHKAHCLNRMAALVWQNCDGTQSCERIALALEVELQEAVGLETVWLAVEQLSRRSLLEKRVALPGGRPVSRRAVMRRLGAAAAVALPLITSLMMPTPAMAASCLAAGQPCNTSAECCSGLCNGSPGTCA
jgi:hypothetical protein